MGDIYKWGAVVVMLIHITATSYAIHTANWDMALVCIVTMFYWGLLASYLGELIRMSVVLRRMKSRLKQSECLTDMEGKSLKEKVDAILETQNKNN